MTFSLPGGCGAELQERFFPHGGDLELIGDSWDKVHRASKIHLMRDSTFPTFEGRTHTLKAGDYIIEGFYADVVKLQRDNVDYCIPSIRLKEFYRRKK